MKILILAAMDKEVQLLHTLLAEPDRITVDGISCTAGTVGGNDVVVAKCGIGKVNSALNAYRLITALHPDLVINSGVAGGAGVAVGTLLVADRIAYHDVWCGPGTQYGAADSFPVFFSPDPRVVSAASKVTESLPGEPVATGLICSGDMFISTPGQVAGIRGHFPDVKAIDMESASIAQTCTMLGIPFAVVRVVSDTPGEGDNISQYQDFWSLAPVKTFKAVSTILSNL